MEITRKLATIQTVKEVLPIEGADNIVLVTFDKNNWRCVMKKNEADEGLRVVYFEVDSLLPKDDERFAFMEPRGFRVKTVKLRGQISQGLAMPVMLFADEIPIEAVHTDADGYDVSAILKVEKYEPPVSVQMGGDVKGAFPGFVMKTDEERIQNYTEEDLTRFFAHPLIATVKVDGTSATYYYNDQTDEFGVCSRNLELKHSEDNIYWKMERKYDLQNRLRHLNYSFAIQGEIVGPGIQKNRAHFEENMLLVFTIQDLEEHRRLTADEMRDVIEDLNSFSDATPIQTVPEIGRYEPNTFTSYDELLELSQGDNVVNHYVREGIVVRALDDDTISWKVINPKYLLKHDL
ncbi:MAG: RNA ligase (ATP) [Actinobacteria bacterium]|nr:RNA ligase (ATP) [Actinomycetota bacterium]